jgi:hypothetical protein
MARANLQLRLARSAALRHSIAATPAPFHIALTVWYAESHVLGFLQLRSTIGPDLQCILQSFCSPCRPMAMPLYDDAKICRCLNRIGGPTLPLA